MDFLELPDNNEILTAYIRLLLLITMVLMITINTVNSVIAHQGTTFLEMSETPFLDARSFGHMHTPYLSIMTDLLGFFKSATPHPPQLGARQLPELSLVLHFLVKIGARSICYARVQNKRERIGVYSNVLAFPS